jgi:hypothetical protein
MTQQYRIFYDLKLLAILPGEAIISPCVFAVFLSPAIIIPSSNTGVVAMVEKIFNTSSHQELFL